MRLWHKDLIRGLPRQQLLGQWRECCLIAKLIHDNGAPNHMLVNKIMDYPISHFYEYGRYIHNEMVRRGYTPDHHKFMDYFNLKEALSDVPGPLELFKDWHNSRYMSQCFYNLQEKYDCGGLTDDEWDEISKCVCLFYNSDYPKKPNYL